MANDVKVKLDTSGAIAGLDAITQSAKDAVRPAAQAGAQVLYEEVLRRVPVSDGPHTFYGTHQRYRFAAGTLRDSIYQVYSKDNSTGGVALPSEASIRATYHVAWNHRKAPYGFMVEFGTSRAPAHPFLRPAYDAVYKRAEEVANAYFAFSMKDVLS